MGKAFRASLLILVLACSAQAGYIPNESPAPPPAQPGYMPNGSPTASEPTGAVNEPTVNGEMPNLAPDSLTQLALDLLAVLPSLL
jgi:hypothetical protein